MSEYETGTGGGSAEPQAAPVEAVPDAGEDEKSAHDKLVERIDAIEQKLGLDDHATTDTTTEETS